MAPVEKTKQITEVTVAAPKKEEVKRVEIEEDEEEESVDEVKNYRAKFDN